MVRSKSLMKMSHGAEYLAARVAAGLFQILPHRTAVAWGGRLGRLVGRLWSVRRRVVLRNLEVAFGETLTDRQRRRLTDDIFANLGCTLAEISRFPRLTRESILHLVTSEGEESFQEVLDYGRGAVLVGSHFGNWELVGAYIKARGYPVDFLVRAQHNPYFDRYLTYLRQSCGIGVIHSEQGMTEVLRALKQNRQIAIIADQHAGAGGIVTTFFGRPVSVPRAPATLAVKLGVPMMTGYILRNPDHTHHCRFEPPIYPDPQADPENEIVRLTTIFTQRMEAAIRLRPDLWLWTHRRFKQVAGTEQIDYGSVR